MKQILTRFPEYYFLLLALLCGYTPPFQINPFVLCLIFPLILLIIFKNRKIWIMIASSSIVISLCLIPALISEVSEFSAFIKGAQQLLFGGSAIILLNIIMCGALLTRYTKESAKAIFSMLGLLVTGIYSLASLAISQRYPGHTTSDILYYAGLALLIFTGIIAAYKWCRMEITALQAQVS